MALKIKKLKRYKKKKWIVEFDKMQSNSDNLIVGLTVTYQDPITLDLYF